MSPCVPGPPVAERGVLASVLRGGRDQLPAASPEGIATPGSGDRTRTGPRARAKGRHSAAWAPHGLRPS